MSLSANTGDHGPGYGTVRPAPHGLCHPLGELLAGPMGCRRGVAHCRVAVKSGRSFLAPVLRTPSLALGRS